MLHIELTNLCTLKCPGCHRTQRINEGEMWKNHSLKLQDLQNFLDVNLDGQKIVLCGNYGDSIYHPDFINIIKWFKHKGASIQLTTNGSHRKWEFWNELASILDTTDEVIFSIDGLPDNFTKYRINGDWDSTEVGIQAMALSSARVVWKYIVFNYNENDIAEAEALAGSLGVDEFSTHMSNRYTDEFNNEYLPSEEYINKQEIEARQKVLTNQEVTFAPKCVGNNRSFHYFIDAEGYFVPCCLLADRRFYYDTDFSKNRDQYDIRTTTLSQVLNNLEEFYKFEDPIAGCKFYCSR